MYLTFHWCNPTFKLCIESRTASDPPCGELEQDEVWIFPLGIVIIVVCCSILTTLNNILAFFSVWTHKTGFCGNKCERHLLQMRVILIPTKT